MVCSRKKSLRSQGWNEYKPNTIALQPVADKEGCISSTSSISQEALKKEEEIKKMEECID